MLGSGGGPPSSQVLSKVLAERPEDALAQIEAISAQVKATRFTSGPHSATSGAAVTEAMVAAKVRRPPLGPPWSPLAPLGSPW